MPPDANEKVVPVSNNASAEKHLLDGRKLLFEAFKHITTLSSGSIVLLAALLGKGGLKLEGFSVCLVFIATCGFFLCTGSAAIVMFFIAKDVREGKISGHLSSEWAGWFVIASIVAFVIGLLALGVLAILSLTIGGEVNPTR